VRLMPTPVRGFTTGIARAVDMGKMLTEAKALAGHGNWLPFLKECGISKRTASRSMRLAAVPPDKLATVALLGIRAADEALATPSGNAREGAPDGYDWGIPIDDVFSSVNAIRAPDLSTSERDARSISDPCRSSEKRSCPPGAEGRRTYENAITIRGAKPCSRRRRKRPHQSVARPAIGHSRSQVAATMLCRTFAA
jgi:Protein of unknown function (DUF3102)